MRRRTLLIPAAVALLGVVAIACSSNDAGNADTGGVSGVDALEPMPAARAEGDGSLRGVGSDASGAAGGAEAIDLPPLDDRVIKTANVRVRVAHGKFRAAFDEAQTIAERYGGFTSTASSGGDDARRGTLVMRLPTASFGAALQDIKSLGAEVLDEEISSRDVSEEFVDLEARLRNYQTQEGVLLDLMNEARDVADTIRVQRELQATQLEIERIKGRLRFLEDQTDMSTISASMLEAGAAPDGPGRLERAWQRAVDTFMSLVAGAVAGLGAVVPLALLIVLGVAVARRVIPRAAG